LTPGPGESLGRALVAHLRAAFGAPALELAEPPVALAGGFDTEIYAVRLHAAPRELTGPLVLRLLRPHHDPMRALREAATQNAVAALGFPAPRVLLAEAVPAPLGAPFVLMERVPGRPLLASGLVGLGARLAALQLRLHALEATSVARVLGASGTFEGYLEACDARIARAKADGLVPLLAWLRAHRPPAATPVICHGDFHPQNVLVDRDRVTGVLDWPNALVAEPAFDVASTLNILRFVPATLSSAPAALRWAARAAQPLLARRYLAAYRRARPIDDRRLAYHQVAAGLRALVRGAESRRGLAGAPTGLDASPYAVRLLARARALTGVEATLEAR
jgi:aminoglycoside phosphotransferase (APT) family kinase protein